VQSEHGYEPSDAEARPVFLFGFVLALLLAASLAVSAWLAQSVDAELEAAEELSPVRELRRAPEGPQLLAQPARELERQRAWEERTLGATEWIDPINQVVRIPIERALELTLAEGLPSRAVATPVNGELER
jgi:hypothetical protein